MVITFVITIFITNTFLTNKLTNQARIDLNTQADAVLETLETTRFDISQPRKALTFLRNGNVGSLVPSDLFLLGENRKVIYASNTDYTEDLIKSIVTTDNPSYIRAVRTLEAEEGFVGYILLISEVKYISNSVRTLRRALILGMLVSLVFAGIIALVMRRSIVKPIKSLQSDIEKNKDNPDHVIRPIRTNDELEDLYEAYVDMNQSINNHLDERKRFFQNASHELKTPLMSIQGYAEGIVDGVIEGEDVNRSLDIIINKSQQLKRTVEEIVYLSKLVNHDFEYEFVEVDLMELIHSIILDVSLLASERGIDIQLDSASDSVIAKVDKVKFESVIENLLSNGLRYANKLIKVQVVDESGKVIIRVLDDGQGLKSGEESKVFERFYKGDKGNSGIGLAIVAEIVKSHKGHIRAGNHIGGGAAFEITLDRG